MSGPGRAPSDRSAGSSARLRRPALIVALLAVVLSACAGTTEEPAPDPAPAEAPEVAAEPEPEPAPAPEPEEPEEPFSLVATATVPEVAAYATPDASTEPTHVLAHPNPVGAPRVFLVEQRTGDGWLEVLLPVRPNGTTGWIQEADVTLARNPYRIAVDIEAFTLTVHRGNDLVVDTTIGYGTEDTPTPGGRYYLVELLEPPNPEGGYGPFAFGLSGFSEVLLSYSGGEGVIGIHGTNDPDSIGIPSSDGCIRVHNDVITELASFLPLGTPVTID
ncbi:MAG: L,D-transpeptidase [Nitriliruptoraceae bacterium]